MTIVKIGMATHALGQSLRKALATAAELGADGVEIDLRGELPLADLSQSGIRQFRKLLEDHNLRLAAASYPTRRGYEDPAELDRRLQGTRQAMRMAAQLGARVLVGRAYGDLPEEDSPRREALMQALESLAHEGNRVGARFCALTTSAPVDELAGLLGQLPEGTLGVALDPARLLESNQSPLDALEHLGKYVSHVYANDAVRDFGSSRAVPVQLGRGSADLPALVAMLDALDYTGWFTANRSHSGDARSELAAAVEYLRSLAMG
ncbi:sugar phosphate isomerase/epimerase [Aeoliella sp. ICT_H6.2]|uniref:Sugar phosphate isomerase/epimerase n=1 Tax=Aeoliella straminimaris TaxID=2954799 RepID=A0A9X2FA33_9BACT|nr:sugar phosphate isomerase/epimerase [Aeoliella straminimaris]